jgi:hypothetical protein
MNLRREHEDHRHDEPPRSAPARARRDLLGLASLLGPDSDLVPISDLDGGAGCSSPETAASGREPSPSALALCGSCTTRCATATLALARTQNSAKPEDLP